MRRGAVVAISFGLVAACGARTPLIVDRTCRGDTIPVTTELPTLVYVLDHSGSMKDGMPPKWQQVRSALSEVMAQVNDSARFAVEIFPQPGAGACATGQEVMPPTRGNGVQTVQDFLVLTSPDPDGGTPTAATLESLAMRMTGAKNTWAILATDGGPNCNDMISCDTNRCILNIEALGGCTLSGPNCCKLTSQNCIDDVRTIDAVKKLKSAGVPTFVVGVPGSEIYTPVLEGMAYAGGTARDSSPRYYRADTPDVLTATLQEIASNIVRGCTLHLDRAPHFPAGVRVSIRGVWRAQGSDFSIAGDVLTLIGDACSAYNGEIAQLHVEDGCAIPSQ